MKCQYLSKPKQGQIVNYFTESLLNWNKFDGYLGVRHCVTVKHSWEKILCKHVHESRTHYIHANLPYF